MHRMRRVYLLCENMGVLRYIARFVRAKTGLKEVRFFERWRMISVNDSWRWPMSALTASTIPSAMVPPISWAFFIDELREMLTEEFGIDPGSELECALLVQHALLPTPGRYFPVRINLPHDYAGWHEAVLDLKLGEHRDDWEDHAPALGDFDPASIEISDPRNVSESALARGSAIFAYIDWELNSPISRPAPGHHQV